MKPTFIVSSLFASTTRETNLPQSPRISSYLLRYQHLNKHTKSTLQFCSWSFCYELSQLTEQVHMELTNLGHFLNKRDSLGNHLFPNRRHHTTPQLPCAKSIGEATWTGGRMRLIRHLLYSGNSWKQMHQQHILESLSRVTEQSGDTRCESITYESSHQQYHIPSQSQKLLLKIVTPKKSGAQVHRV